MSGVDVPDVFDTNALVLLLTDSPRLSDAAREAALVTVRERWVSAASIYEVTFKARLGKLPIDPMAFRRSLRLGGFEVRAVTEHVMCEAATLDWSNRDPWDRIIGATARQSSARLISSDRAFDDVEGVERIW